MPSAREPWLGRFKGKSARRLPKNANPYWINQSAWISRREMSDFKISAACKCLPCSFNNCAFKAVSWGARLHLPGGFTQYFGSMIQVTRFKAEAQLAFQMESQLIQLRIRCRMSQNLPADLIVTGLHLPVHISLDKDLG